MRRTVGATLLVMAVAITPPAAAAGDHDFAGTVPGIAGKTWTDLLSQVFPDIAATADGYAEASEMIDLRSIGAGDESWISCGDKIAFRDRDARLIRLGSRDYFIVTLELEDDCVGLLALFDDSGKLVDAVNVKGDQHISFSGNYLRPLGRDGALVIASLWHDNSSQSYDITSLILARPQGLTSLGDVLALGSRECGDSDKRKPGQLVLEESKVHVVANGDALARIELGVTRGIQKLDSEDCEAKIGREVHTNFDGYWRWNAKKRAYQAHIKELDLLAKWNENHL